LDNAESVSIGIREDSPSFLEETNPALRASPARRRLATSRSVVRS